MSSQRVDPKVFIGIFLISMASLALEVLQMRIFAFSLWHHLAFLVISIAILGFGAAGAFLSVTTRLREAHLGRSIALAGLFFTAAAFVGPYYLAKAPVDVFDQWRAAEFGKVALYYLMFSLPYFFAGYIVSIALTQCAEQVSKLYFVNLVGSGLGCFLLFAILTPLGAAGSLVVIASLGALVAVLSPSGWFLRGLGVVAFVCCLSVMPGINPVLRPLVDPIVAQLPRLDDKDPEKHPHRLLEAEEIFRFKSVNSKFIRTYTHGPLPQKVLATRWSPLGRIDITSDPTVSGVVGERVEPGACLFQDGDAPGQMPHRSWKAPPDQIHGISYVIKERPDVLIIGLGGGLDVNVALDRGAKSITGVEINPQSFELYTEQFKELVGDPKSRPEVSLHIGEGRHFVRSSDQKYDLIQMSGVDTYTALANGAYVLSESYLYTREAILDFWDHLADDGMMTMIRFAWPKPREMLRALVITLDALGSRRIADPWQHVVILKNHRGENKQTKLGAMMVKKSPFTKAELDRLRTWADAGANKYSTDYLPDESGDNEFHALVKSYREGKAQEFLDGYEFKIDPVTDDGPFFFDQHRWSAVWDWLWSEKAAPPKTDNPVWAALHEKFQKEPVGLSLLAITIAQLAVLVALCIFGPLLLLRKSLQGVSAKAPLGYFLCLGLAYIFLMISAMQRFSLILGHPTYSITITMATFMIASGLGSLVSGRFAVKRSGLVVSFVALVLVASAFVFTFELPGIAETLLTQSFAIRVLATVGLLAPIAFVMGMCFPTGIRVLALSRKALIPWAYGVNGAASVLGSVLTVCLAMALGFTKVHWIASGLYVLAAVLMIVMARQARTGVQIADAEAAAAAAPAAEDRWLT